MIPAPDALALLGPPLLLGLEWMEWMDPQWLLDRFGAEFLWISLLIVFVECGLFFPFLPGDTLLFALGIFLATGEVDLFPGPPVVELGIAVVLLVAAAFLGNVVGYEIGRALGPPLHERDGRVLRREHLERTRKFFDTHGHKALVIGRFVPFVRTFVTVVAGATRMDRRRFLLWSLVGAALWVLSITLLGYLLGNAVPWLGHNIDYVVLGLLVAGSVPMAWEWWRHRRQGGVDVTYDPTGEGSEPAPAPTSTPPTPPAGPRST